MKNGETYNNGKGNRTNKTIRNAKRHKYNLVNSLFHIIDRLFKRIVPVQAKKLQTSRICMLDTNTERLSNCNLIRCTWIIKSWDCSGALQLGKNCGCIWDAPEQLEQLIRPWASWSTYWAVIRNLRKIKTCCWSSMK